MLWWALTNTYTHIHVIRYNCGILSLPQDVPSRPFQSVPIPQPTVGSWTILVVMSFVGQRSARISWMLIALLSPSAWVGPLRALCGSVIRDSHLWEHLSSLRINLVFIVIFLSLPLSPCLESLLTDGDAHPWDFSGHNLLVHVPSFTFNLSVPLHLRCVP